MPLFFPSSQICASPLLERRICDGIMSEFLFECRQRSTYPLCFQDQWNVLIRLDTWRLSKFKTASSLDHEFPIGVFVHAHELWPFFLSNILLLLGLTSISSC